MAHLDDDTLRIIQAKNRPVLLFVAVIDPFVWPFLSGIFQAMPANAGCGSSSTTSTPPCSSRRIAIPADLKTLGAGSNYHIAVLSPYGLTPMVTIEIQRSPEEVVRTSLKFSSVSSMSGGDEHLNMSRSLGTGPTRIGRLLEVSR